MVWRNVNILESNSFFLFGPRGTGKTTLLKQLFLEKECLWIDLLDPREEDTFLRDPALLSERLREVGDNIEWVILDEIQKAPRLLDVVHHEIETNKRKFALTGSSARKLKRGGANLLAGRAFVYHLFPLTHRELGRSFLLSDTLEWGALPKLLSFCEKAEKVQFLEAYVHTYLKEEVIAEQLVRKTIPFRSFLEIASQANGEIINFSKIADDVRVDLKTIRSYFEILEDTLLGFFLPPYHRSLRKQQHANPKFYFFDCGVQRALERTLSIPLKKNSSVYGKAFEHFVILEIYRLNEYLGKHFRLSYLRTKDDAEIDLIVERPGCPLALVEIKSAPIITDRHLSTLQRFAKDLPEAEAFCLSCDPHPRKVGNVRVLPWQAGIEALGLV